MISNWSLNQWKNGALYVIKSHRFHGEPSPWPNATYVDHIHRSHWPRLVTSSVRPFPKIKILQLICIQKNFNSPLRWFVSWYFKATCSTSTPVKHCGSHTFQGVNHMCSRNLMWCMDTYNPLDGKYDGIEGYVHHIIDWNFLTTHSRSLSTLFN